MLLRGHDGPQRVLSAHAWLCPAMQRKNLKLHTRACWGGVLHLNHASVDPARCHQGSLQRVLAAGAQLVTRCPATRIAAPDAE